MSADAYARPVPYSEPEWMRAEREKGQRYQAAKRQAVVWLTSPHGRRVADPGRQADHLREALPELGPSDVADLVDRYGFRVGRGGGAAIGVTCPNCEHAFSVELTGEVLG
ncbi:hypothetical protein [Kribbella sp. NPDC051137]|uniref:hypothetical protein n=1 Tax=Kribbella sp. NPDC051137 TaxID=3155045 RepID=UPI00343F3D21